ncbi:hypothetical protein G7054_g321 [Neopestalotiopsis clavispora]|nr:hypothetical protein G7054_g321 [Neopestalotiopsis clavispora]
MAEPADFGGWQAPTFNQLNFNGSCPAATRYFAETVLYKTDDHDSHFLDGTTSAKLGTILWYLDSLIPSNWTTPPHEPVDKNNNYNQALMDWYFNVWKNQTYIEGLVPEERDKYDVFMNQSRAFAYHCNLKNICDLLQVPGDPDVSGIGMLWIYYILAILTTLYFSVVAIEQLGVVFPAANGASRKWAQSGVVNSFSKTLDEFLDSVLVFAASMLGATLYRYSAWMNAANVSDTIEISTYTIVGSAIMSIFSLFACLVLQMVSPEWSMKGRRIFLWAIIFGFAIGAEIMCRLIVRDFYETLGSSYQANYYGYQDLSANFTATSGIKGSDYRRMRILELRCYPKGFVHYLLKLVSIGFGLQDASIFFISISLLLFIIMMILEFIPKDNPAYRAISPKVVKVHPKDFSLRSKRTLRLIRLTAGLVYLAMIWILLGNFKSYRKQVGHFATNQDSQWSFGQILALATWAPAAISLAAHLLSKLHWELNLNHTEKKHRDRGRDPRG